MYGRKYFGLFKGTPYGSFDETIDDYKRQNSVIDRNKVIDHFSHLNFAATSAPTYDINSGEFFPAGLYDDGPFSFTTDFVRYYNQGIVDIPEEYEDFLLGTL